MTANLDRVLEQLTASVSAVERGEWSMDEEKSRFFESSKKVELNAEGLKHYSNFVGELREHKAKKDVVQLLKRFALDALAGKSVSYMTFHKRQRRRLAVKLLEKLDLPIDIETGYGNIFCLYRLYIKARDE